jgi:predicted deacylase
LLASAVSIKCHDDPTRAFFGFGVSASNGGGLPHFEVQVIGPKLDPWLRGTTGIRGFTSHDSPEPGPHVCITALVHGNEIAGAVALDRLLQSDVRPRRGRLTMGFINLAAYARFDPRSPTASRFVDEDLNRVWDPDVLDGTRRSSELDRAREIRPLIDTVDVLLDLHSMLWPSDPLILSGASPRGRALAQAIGTPAMVVADQGHASGPRLIDYPPFTRPDSGKAAILVEAGQHWQQNTVDTAMASIAGLLNHLQIGEVPATGPSDLPRFAEVTQVITAETGSFTFMQPYRGGEVVARRDTLIAVDGMAEIRTPHDDCLLVMPSLRPSRGHTAVRLARFG